MVLDWAVQEVEAVPVYLNSAASALRRPGLPRRGNNAELLQQGQPVTDLPALSDLPARDAVVVHIGEQIAARCSR